MTKIKQIKLVFVFLLLFGFLAFFLAKSTTAYFSSQVNVNQNQFSIFEGSQE